jgi:methionine synthase I (cobalamin-dependent)
MTKKLYKVETLQDFETLEAALAAAKKAKADLTVEISEVTVTDSGQSYERIIVWRDGKLLPRRHY